MDNYMENEEIQNEGMDQEMITGDKIPEATDTVCSLKKDNRGIGVVEIVLILVVLIALIIIFKDKIMEIINSAFESISEGANSL